MGNGGDSGAGLLCRFSTVGASLCWLVDFQGDSEVVARRRRETWPGEPQQVQLSVSWDLREWSRRTWWSRGKVVVGLKDSSTQH